MNEAGFSQIREMWGGWSTCVSAIGVSGAFASFLLSWTLNKEPTDGRPVKVIGALPWLMGVIALFIVFWAMQASVAYSGPLSEAARDVVRYDMRLAASIAFAFGMVFALDALRFQKLRGRIFTWLCIVAYVFANLWKGRKGDESQGPISHVQRRVGG